MKLFNLDCEAAARASDGPAIGHLHSPRIAIVCEINLRGIAPERRINQTHEPHKQARLRVEIKLHGRLAFVESEDHIDFAVADLFLTPYAERLK